MKAARWRDLSEDETRQKIRELSEEVFNLRFQLSMGVAKNPSRVREARRDLARATTVLRERGLAVPTVETPARPAARPRKPAASRKTSVKKKPTKKA